MNVRSVNTLSILLVLGIFLIGCISAPTTTPAPTTPAPTMAPTMAPPTPAPTKAPVVAAPKVILSTMPMKAVAGEEVLMAWQVAGGKPGKITHSAIHWGKEPGKALVADYPTMTELATGNTPQLFSAKLKVPTEPGTYYYRAHATVDGVDVYSDEETISIGEQPKIRLVTYPSDVLVEDTMIFKWEVTGGAPGNITHTAVHAGWKSGKVVTDYAFISNQLIGQSPNMFAVTMKAPGQPGTLYFRAHAIVDGQHVYTGEHTIRVLSLDIGGQGG